MCVQCNDFDVEKMDQLFVGRGEKKMTKPNQTEKSGFCSYFGVWFDLIFVLLSFRQIMRFAQVLFACFFSECGCGCRQWDAKLNG